jgi:hypothetical protein
MIVCRRAPGRVWIAGEAAAALMELDGCRRGRVFAVTTANVRSKRSKVRFKRVAAMPASDATVLRGLPVTSVDRTLIDLGDDLPAERVELAYECAFRRRLTHPRRLKQRIEEIEPEAARAPQSFGGSSMSRKPALRREARSRGHVLTAQPSLGAAHTHQAARVTGCERPDLPGRFHLSGNEHRREVDGRAFHLRRLKWEEDLERRNRLTASGLRVLHVTYRRMKCDPQGVIAELAAALGVHLVVK